jgi:hypothetical protein
MVKESLRPCEFGCYPGALPDWTRSGVTDDEVIRVALLIRAVDEALGDNLSPTRW